MSQALRIIPLGEEPKPRLRSRAGQPVNANGERGTGRFLALNAFVDETLRSLKGRNDVAVWLVLYRDTKPNGWAAAFQSDIARRIGASESTVKRAIRRLKKRGLLKPGRRGRPGHGPSTYKVLGRAVLRNGGSPG
jgi:hypothetical protein